MADDKKEYSEAVKKNLKVLADKFDLEDQSVRERQLRLWKKLDYYWAGFTRTWWSDVAHNYQIADNNYAEGSDDQSYYDKPINVFRAFLETIIAAMSVSVPPVKCLPDDADNTNDCVTARGGTKIAELIYKHNNAELLWCKALYVYCIQGMIAAYTYPAEDAKYGTVKVDNYEDESQDIPISQCPTCGTELDASGKPDEEMDLSALDEFQPEGPEELPTEEQTVHCPTCSANVEPQAGTKTITVKKLVGVTSKPKSRQIIDVVGGLFVKVPNYARCQADIPYLRYSYETHYSNVLAKYGDNAELREKLDKTTASHSGYDINERWARLSPQYHGGSFPIDTPSVNNWWFRPSSFECITDETEREELKKEFPDGAKLVLINDTFAEACNECLDDYWTLTMNPLSEYIHFDPLGLLLTSIQEINDDLVSLSLQTIEHGISQVFADSSVLNFSQYRKQETTPGNIFPVKPKGGRNLSESFFELRTATLSQEVGPFAEKINELGQFVSGALPSLSGGSADNSSKTAAQYAMSRQQAMQRLQTPWKMINMWWKDIFGKVIPSYIRLMIDDERSVKRDGDNYINVVIKQAELNGKLGDIELESSESIPISEEQVRDIVMELLKMQNPEILEMLGTPGNIPWMARTVGLNKFVIPGADDREKQNEEIKLLSQSGPIPTPDGNEFPSIMPEMDVDNHAIEADVCRSYLVSEAGRVLKTTNEPAYKNILLHMKIHKMMMQQQMMQEMAMSGSAPQSEPAKEGQENGNG